MMKMLYIYSGGNSCLDKALHLNRHFLWWCQRQLKCLFTLLFERPISRGVLGFKMRYYMWLQIYRLSKSEVHKNSEFVYSSLSNCRRAWDKGRGQIFIQNNYSRVSNKCRGQNFWNEVLENIIQILILQSVF